MSVLQYIRFFISAKCFSGLEGNECEMVMRLKSAISYEI